MLKGVEISEPHLYPKQIETLTEAFNFDLVIGSIHNIPNVRTSKNKKYITRLYYKEILRMIESSNIDVIGHLDYINKYYGEDYSEDDQISEIFQAVKERDQIIEINTSAERRARLNVFPSVDKISRYKLVSNCVTIGSDAHRYSELTDNLEQAELIAKLYGLKPVIYEKRKRIVL